MTVLHTHFYIVVDTQRGCHTLKKESTTFYPLVDYVFLYECINLHWRNRRKKTEKLENVFLIKLR